MSAVLSKVAVFEELGAAGLETLSGFLESRTYEKGFLLFQQDQEAAELIVVAEGQVVLRQSGTEIARVEAGECLGGVSLVVIGHRECEAAAEGPVEVLSLTRESYLRLRADYPSVALDLQEGILRHLGAALRDLLPNVSNSD
ncbi:MAG: cyclic nucleotide-binding domain-containing protein [Deltaproteobacteria bacterium]|nr:cyclic nucleotide-binding domain-containing protein [Deltaproteobacteria bacterium]